MHEPERWIVNRILYVPKVIPQIAHKPVGRIVEQIVHVIKIIPQRRASQRRRQHMRPQRA